MLQSVDSFIGRMFGHQSAAATYGGNRVSPLHGETESPRSADIVELSDKAPRPLEASLFRDAVHLAEKMVRGEELSPREHARMREDRIFTAVAVLSAIGLSENGMGGGWPAGLPTPTGAELDAAYRRLSQRLLNLDKLRDPATMQKIRQSVLDSFRNADFNTVSDEILGDG